VLFFHHFENLFLCLLARWDIVVIMAIIPLQGMKWYRVMENAQSNSIYRIVCKPMCLL